jgi:hypothetical protein
LQVSPRFYLWADALCLLTWHFSSTIPEFNYTKLSAIRYLAGILELPAFWEKGINVQKRFSDILTVLCHTIFNPIQDTGKSEADVDVDLNGDSPPWMSALRDATDNLASATFDGLLRLYERDRLITKHCRPSSSVGAFKFLYSVNIYILSLDCFVSPDRK